MINQPLELEKMYGKVCSLVFKFEYKFGRSTARKFIESIQSMPWVEQEDEMPVIDFGNTLEVCGIMNVYQILKSSEKRVKVLINLI
jgi:hypothetical protein